MDDSVGEGTPIVKLAGRIVSAGKAQGLAIVASEPVGFLGGIDPETGIVIEPGHSLEGQCVSGKVLVFPHGKGSTVGSYTLYRMSRLGTAPVAMINAHSEAIAAVGAIISDIPMVDLVDISQIRTGDRLSIDGAWISVER